MCEEYIKLGIEAKRKRIAQLPYPDISNQAKVLSDDINLYLSIELERIGVLSNLLELASRSKGLDDFGNDLAVGTLRMIEHSRTMAVTFHRCLECNHKTMV